MNTRILFAVAAAVAGVFASHARSFEVSAWRGETVAVQIPDYVEFGRMPDGFGFRFGALKPVKYAPDPGSLRRLEVYDRVDWRKEEEGPRVVEISVPADAKPGLYDCGMMKVRVVDRVLPPPKEWKYYLDLWQHPWAIARIAKVKPFSKEHYAAMRPVYELLATAGQKTITVPILDRPWDHQCYDAYHSIVDDADFRTFDEYVAFCRDCGIGPEISCYSLCPWTFGREIDADELEKRWGAFFDRFVAHLKEKEWFAQTLMAMDERKPEDVRKVAEFVRRHAPGMRIAIAGNRKPSEFDGIDIDNYCQCLKYFTPDFLAEIPARRAKGFVTTHYVCCSPVHPNTFLSSGPGEAFWLGASPAMLGFDGFLRWAWNSWPQNPKNDASYGGWPAGDTFLCYPGGEPSWRFLELRNGIIAAEKVRILKEKGLFRDELAKVAALYKVDEAIANKSDFLRIRKVTREVVDMDFDEKIIERSGNGADDKRWHSGAFAVEPNATYALGFEAKASGSSGCVLAGIDGVNVDLPKREKDWTAMKYVFRTREDLSAARLHLGQWHFNGTVSFRKPVLERVRSVHESVEGVTLGAGEQIGGRVYHFTSRLGGFALNDCRALVSARRVDFNTSRWCLTDGSEITYRHAVSERRFGSGEIRVGCCHWTRGAAGVEASSDGRDWTRLGAVTNASRFAFVVPASLFPANELWVRFVGAKGTTLQINSYSLDAQMDGEDLWACGGTRYVSERTGQDIGRSTVPSYFATDYGELVAEGKSAALWRASSGRKVPPRRILPKARAEAIQIRTAANEAEAAQLVVTPKTALSDVRVTLTDDLVSDAAERIPVASVDILRVAYVNVEQATDAAGVCGLWPDPLPPQDGKPLAVATGMNQPFWIRVKPPKGTPKGIYCGELKVTMDAETLTVPLKVEVFGFDLPDTMTCETAFGADMSKPWRYHAAKTKAERETVAAKYLKALADCHLSPYDPTPGVSWRVTWKGDEPAFDWAEWDAAMEKAIAERHITSFRLRVDGLGNGTYQGHREPRINGVSTTDPRYETMMDRYLKGVESHLREKGWLGMAYVYWFDEPREKDYPFVMNGFQTLKRHAPGLRRMLTEQVEKALVGGPNVWCPDILYWNRAELMRARMTAGETLWWYICTVPKAPFLGEFIDHSSNELRMWLWQTWGEQVGGVLIWETLYWHSPTAYPDALQNPYADTMSWVSDSSKPKGTRGPWGNGDGRFFYPPQALADGKAKTFTDGEPVASFRSEGLRDGIEDYEYFAMLKRLDPQNPLLVVPKSVYTSLTDFSVDPTPLEEHRLKLAREIERIRRGRPR